MAIPGPLAASVVSLAWFLRLDGAWLTLAALLLAGYFVAPRFIWRQCRGVAIKACRDGVRVDVSMQPFVAEMTGQDVEDVEDLAAYYAPLSPCPDG